MADESQEPTWEYKSEKTSESHSAPEHSDNHEEKPAIHHTDKPVTWTASEFIAHHKNISWYLLFASGIGICAAGIYFLTKDLISTGVIGFAGLLFMMLANHKPRQLSYKMDDSGIHIGEKFYPYSHFKSFDVVHEGAIGAINLLPLKRFMPELSIYFPPEEEDKIVNTIIDHLPHDEHIEQPIDTLLKKIRF